VKGKRVAFAGGGRGLGQGGKQVLEEKSLLQGKQRRAQNQVLLSPERGRRITTQKREEKT